jgi:hypothetical protein
MGAVLYSRSWGFSPRFVVSVPIDDFGTVLALLAVYFSVLNNQASLDGLTGLNNRGQLLRYRQAKDEQGGTAKLGIDHAGSGRM